MSDKGLMEIKNESGRNLIKTGNKIKLTFGGEENVQKQ